MLQMTWYVELWEPAPPSLVDRVEAKALCNLIHAPSWEISNKQALKRL